MAPMRHDNVSISGQERSCSVQFYSRKGSAMPTGLSYLASSDLLDTRPPMLVAAGTAGARTRAMRWLAEAGWRTAEVPIDGALERLALQAAASGLWIEVEAGDSGEPLDRLLAYANG
jgi:hypothetical protein